MPAPRDDTATALQTLLQLQTTLSANAATEAQRNALARVVSALKHPAFAVILARSAQSTANAQTDEEKNDNVAPLSAAKKSSTAGKRPVSMIQEGDEEPLPAVAVAVATPVAVAPKESPRSAAIRNGTTPADDRSPIVASAAAIASMTQAFTHMSQKIAADSPAPVRAGKEPAHSADAVSKVEATASSASSATAAATVALAAASGDAAQPTQHSQGVELRVIELQKGDGGLGFNIVGGKDHGHRIFVSRIVDGGVASRDGRLKLGDQLIEVNGHALAGLAHEAAAEVLKTSKGLVVVKVVHDAAAWEDFQRQVQEAKKRASASTSSVSSVAQAASNPVAPPVVAAAVPAQSRTVKTFHVKALFSLDKVKDRDCPGHLLPFRAGDVLHVTNAMDDEWWHAKNLDGDKGFIPSRKRVERKDKSKRRSVTFDEKNLGPTEELVNAMASSSSSAPGKKTHFKNSIRMARKSFFFGKKRAGLHLGVSDAVGGSAGDLSGGDKDGVVPTYEIVALREPDGKTARPVIALGHNKDAFYEKLLSDFPESYATYIPHTTRAPRDDEQDGRDYHFVSKDKMEVRTVLPAPSLIVVPGHFIAIAITCVVCLCPD
eukprot:Opistho-2@32600